MSEPAPGAPNEHNEHKEILIVEDHVETAEMLTAILEDEGYTVRWVDRASEALELFPHPGKNGHDREHQDRPPDLILLDLTMPDCDPLEVVQHLSETPEDRPPVIVVSAKPTEAVEEAARTIGAAGIVFKPFPLDVLLQSIDAALMQ